MSVWEIKQRLANGVSWPWIRQFWFWLPSSCWLYPPNNSINLPVLQALVVQRGCGMLKLYGSIEMLRLEKPVRSPSLTISPSPPSPNNHVPLCHSSWTSVVHPLHFNRKLTHNYPEGINWAVAMSEGNAETLISTLAVTYEYKGVWSLEMGELLTKSCMQFFNTRFFYLGNLSLSVLEFRDGCECLRCLPGRNACSVSWCTVCLNKRNARTKSSHAFQSVFWVSVPFFFGH